MSNEPPAHPEDAADSEFDRQLDESLLRTFSPPAHNRIQQILQSAINRAGGCKKDDQKIDDDMYGQGLQSGSPVPHDDEITTGDEQESTRKYHTPRLTNLRKLAVAASILMGTGGVWMIWSYTQNNNPITDPYHNLSHRSFSDIYESAARNQENFWVCKNRRQFITTFWQQLGYGAELNPKLPEGIVALGLSYADALSERSIILGGTANNTEPVVVVIDRMDTETKEALEMPDSDSGLMVYKKESPPLVMYEISRLDHPVLLDNIKSVNMPTEWIPGHARFRKSDNQSGASNQDESGGSDDTGN